MLIENQLIEIQWTAKQRKYYVDRGYLFTKFGDKFNVNVSDLPVTSVKEIAVLCDNCNKSYKLRYTRYIESMEKYGTNYCNHCTQQRTLNERQERHYNSIVEFCNKNNYKLLTLKKEIKSIESNVTYICPKHGEFTTKVKNLLQNEACYKCSRETALRKKYEGNQEERRESLYSKALIACKEKGYIFNTEKNDINNYSTYIKYICPTHGEHKMKIGNLISGKGCPECQLDHAREIYSFKPNQVFEMVEELGGKLTNKEDYINNGTKNLKILCPNCKKNIFTTSLKNFTQHGGQSCPDCSKTISVGERKIKQWLEQNDINFVHRTHWFEDCRDINPLPFDFYLPDYNILIEFDGIQHEKENHWFNHTSLCNIQKHDEIKNKYCKENNIPLIRIPYSQMNHIDEILYEKLIS